MSAHSPSIRRGYAWKQVTSAVAEQSAKRRDHAKAFAAQQKVARERARQAKATIQAQPKRIAESQSVAPEDVTDTVDLISWETPRNLSEALKQDYPGFETALRDGSMGHKAVANAFDFTSESSVRRWRKSNGVEVAK